MPNHVMNRITLDCSDERAKEIMEAVQYDPNQDDEENTGFGTLDFNKLIPMPPSLMIETGSSTEQGIEIYLTAVNPNAPDYDLPKMPEDKFKKLVTMNQVGQMILALRITENDIKSTSSETLRIYG